MACLNNPWADREVKPICLRPEWDAVGLANSGPSQMGNISCRLGGGVHLLRAGELMVRFLGPSEA